MRKVKGSACGTIEENTTNGAVLKPRRDNETILANVCPSIRTRLDILMKPKLDISLIT